MPSACASAAPLVGGDAGLGGDWPEASDGPPMQWGAAVGRGVVGHGENGSGVAAAVAIAAAAEAAAVAAAVAVVVAAQAQAHAPGDVGVAAAVRTGDGGDGESSGFARGLPLDGERVPAAILLLCLSTRPATAAELCPAPSPPFWSAWNAASAGLLSPLASSACMPSKRGAQCPVPFSGGATATSEAHLGGDTTPSK